MKDHAFLGGSSWFPFSLHQFPLQQEELKLEFRQDSIKMEKKRRKVNQVGRGKQKSLLIET